MRVCENTLFIALFILLFITFHFLYKHPHISPIIFLSFILSLELLTKNTRKHMRILDLIRKMNYEERETGLYSEKGRLRITWDELKKKENGLHKR